jgi:hypothetical protein
MPLDELNNLPPAAIDWHPLDRSLLGDARFRPPPFPVRLLPGRWRRWIEAESAVFGSADYLAHCLLGGVACAGGAGIRIAVVSHWREPLLLWQALVGGPSSGRSAAFARVRALLDAVGVPEDEGEEAATAGVEDDEEAEERAPLAPAVLVDARLERLSWAMAGRVSGVLLWREDLAEWHAEAGERPRLRPGPRVGPRPSGASGRAAWLAGWSAAPAEIGEHAKDCVALGLLGALAPEALASFTGGGKGGDGALASRFLYAWPERAAPASLVETEADDAGLIALLRRIASLAGLRESPCVLPVDEAGARRLEELMPQLWRLAEEAEGVATDWVGRGVATIVRLAGVLSLMAWAETDKEYLPVGAAHVDAAYELWSGYYLPHAMAVFDRAGARAGDRAARKVVRWLRRVRAAQVSREEVRREALSQSVDAQEADDVLARLEAGGVVRPVAVTEDARRGPKRRRWEVNPALLGNSAISASALAVIN